MVQAVLEIVAYAPVAPHNAGVRHGGSGRLGFVREFVYLSRGGGWMMRRSVNRRSFLRATAAASAAMGWGQIVGCARVDDKAASANTASGEKSKPAGEGETSPSSAPELFKISLAEWSFHRALKGGQMDNVDFPVVAKNDFGIDCVEWVNQFFMDKAKDESYLKDLKKRCDDNGVTSGLIMCDNEGDLGDPDEAKRTQAIENHYKWVDAAKFLGCHSIRVNARSSGTPEEQHDRAVDGLRRLSEFGANQDMNVIVENHGGLSSNGQWLAGVIKAVEMKNCGTLPDFGNFRVGPNEEYDKYKGVAELMPYAKGVSAKSHVFDADGNEAQIDYFKMMKIVLDAGFHGYVGIEWEGDTPGEKEGVKLTQQLLEKVRTSLAKS
jgi:sugar phosphate isomerase/epimerase